MLKTRVIPALLIDNYNLVKGAKFKNHKYVGDPVNAVKIFNDKEVDEIIFLDISATLHNRGINFNLLEDIVSQAFMPFGYGGGIKDIQQIKDLFKLGVEKVVLNSAVIDNPELILEASSLFGSQSIVVSVDVKKNLFGQYKVYKESGTKDTGLDPISWCLEAEKAGAGEILLTSIDKEGTGKGYDLNLIENISSVLQIPLVASGGASEVNDFLRAVKSGASAVSGGDFFTFYGKHKAVLITYPKYSELEDCFKEI